MSSIILRASSFACVLQQCPFYDEYLVSLHNKIKSKAVEFPET